MQRLQLIEYLCRQQHSVYAEAALIEGVPAVGSWESLPEPARATLRASMSAVLSELESLELLRPAKEKNTCS